MNKKLVLLIIYIIINTFIHAQSIKQEFRAVWIATVANIDWPSSTDLTTTEQQNEIIQILDYHKSYNINAIILQVRPASDAIYQSQLEPWSKYLSGKQGIAPEPYYDPLQFWITEAHKRGMEVHAWFNPYRIKQNLKDSLVENHIIKTNPDWGWEYGNRLYFEPGHPEVWTFVTNVVTDVVNRYDIDAIHFDDYFYPYQVENKAFPDSIAFKEFGGKYYPKNIDDWRRHNTDTIIQILSKAIKSTKPWVKFGISPFGVWRNIGQDPIGSETKAGTTNYDDLYADVIKWQREEWIDYLMPQLYWRDDHPVADYSTLAYWWADYAYNRGMYFGLAPYRIDKKSDHKLWRKEKYFYQHIEILRNLKPVNGYGFFSSNSLTGKKNKIAQGLKKDLCKQPAIVPTMPWIDNIAPKAPINVRYNDNKITWESEKTKNEFNNGRFFVVYKFENNSNRQLKSAECIISITGENYIEFDTKIPEGVYRISSLDRLNNESPLSKPIKIVN